MTCRDEIRWTEKISMRIDNEICDFIKMEIPKYLPFPEEQVITLNIMKIAGAIEKQFGVIPKQDKRKGDGCYCPKCGNFVGIKSEEVTEINNYCSECGQKMKLGDEDGM